MAGETNHEQFLQEMEALGFVPGEISEYTAAAHPKSYFDPATTEGQAHIEQDQLNQLEIAVTSFTSANAIVKPTTRGRERRLTELERHRKMGHIGPAGPSGCPVCKRLTRLRQVNSKENPTPVRDHVPGRTIHADVIYMDVPSREGNNYAVVMIDEATGWITGFFVTH